MKLVDRKLSTELILLFLSLVAHLGDDPAVYVVDVLKPKFM